MASTSSLSSVVSNLLRASMGTSVPSTVTDDDLDRHVADLILKDAKKRAERYRDHGIRAFLPAGGSDSNAPRTNKRFLTSIIRSTDDHNKTILRAQALAAQEVKREREEQERRERRARAEEAAEAERLRRSGKSSKRRRTRKDEEGWDRWDGRTADRKRKMRAWETLDDEDEEEEWATYRRRSRSRSRERHHDKARSSSRSKPRDKSHTSSRRRRDRSRSQSPRRTHGRHGVSRSRLRSPSQDSDKRHSRHSSHRHSKRKRSQSRHRSRTSRRRDASEPIVHRLPSPVMSRESDSTSLLRKRSRSPKYALDDMESDRSESPREHSPRRSPSPSTSYINTDREAEPQSRLNSKRVDDESLIKQSKRSRTPTRGRSPSLSPKPKRRKPRSSSRTSHRRRSVSPEVRSRQPKTDSSSSHTAKTRSVSPIPSRTPTPGPESAVQLPSKMDKYFEETYDPRLDVAPLTAPHVPATGLINNAEFEGWDAMLELIRVRREDKEEKKRMERLGLTKEKLKDKKKGTTDAVGDRWNAEGVSIMEIEYKKRGSVREWDLGKEGF